MQTAGKASLTPAKVDAGKENEQVPLFKKPRVLLVEETISIPTITGDAEGNRRECDPKATIDTAPKKPRKKKSKEAGEGQAKIKKTRITKPGAPKSGNKIQRTASAAKQIRTEKHETFNTLLPSQEEDARAKEEFRDLCLDKSIPPRRQWTPAKDTVQDRSSECATEPSASKRQIVVTTEDPPSVAQFGQLLGDFGLSKKDEIPEARVESFLHTTSEMAFKRRKIEIVEGVPAAPKLEKPKRTKSPRKKPQTITEKATAPFVPLDTVTAPSLLHYFSTPPVPSETVATVQADETVKLVEQKKKIPTRKKPKPQAVTSKIKSNRKPILLSPESALKKMDCQDLLFGTSSQLVREESPTLIKDLEQAMQESANLSQDSGPSIPHAGKFRTSNALALIHSRGLWSAASRDFENSLLEAETVDLTRTPKVTKQIMPALSVGQPDISESQRLTNEKDIDLHATSPVLDAAKLETETTPALLQHQESTLLIPRSMAEATLRKRPNNRSPVKNATNSKADPNQMPNYQGYTDAQLSREVAAYGFKSIKKRTAMITLLEKCWESKVSMATQEVKANLEAPSPATDAGESGAPKHVAAGKKRGRPPKTTPASESAGDSAIVSPPKKPRGRPKKDGATTITTTTPLAKGKKKANKSTEAQGKMPAVVADEIYDSDPPTPSPPRQRSASKTPRKLRLTKSSKTSIDDDVRSPGKDKVKLFEQMTKAITTFAPTRDPKNMTFYEKILIYEPVVLEDLAMWLNTEGLSKVGEDGEVCPAMVKEWCEERSVCCLWRENLRGGTRGRW